jgi:hypothetical protein
LVFQLFLNHRSSALYDYDLFTAAAGSLQLRSIRAGKVIDQANVAGPRSRKEPHQVAMIYLDLAGPVGATNEHRLLSHFVLGSFRILNLIDTKQVSINF